MRFTDANNDNILDAAMEAHATGQPVQLRVTPDDRSSEYAVGLISGAYRKNSTDTARVVVGGIAIRVPDGASWELVVHEEPEAPAPAAEWITEDDTYLLISAMRWSGGKPIGYHLARVTGRLSADALSVQFTLDGYESGALYSGIRATRQEWEAIERFAK